jgi:hypothetical protein
MRNNLIILSFFYCSFIFGQKYDNNWQVCSSIDHDPPIKFWFLNFNSSPPELIKYFSAISYNRANLVMSDETGNMIFYSNGCQIADASHSIMENGDSINLGIGWSEIGYPWAYDIFSIPAPGQENLYYIIHCDYDTLTAADHVIEHINFTMVNMNLNGGLGSITSRNNPFLSGDALAFPAAVKHANGRDWWIVTPKWYQSKYYSQLLTPEGMSQPVSQEIGTKPSEDFIGNKLFTPDGSKYIDYDGRNGIRLFDFDRCTGLLSNPVNCEVLLNETWGGAAVSPNSRFLYITQGYYLLQYDLEAPDICSSVDTLFISNDLLQLRVPLLGPDGKIYIQSKPISHKLHIIHHPDLKGDLSEVELDAFEIPCNNLDDIPNFPNYRLYDIPGSPCDTLGIDDPNVATQEAPVKKIAIFPNPASDMIYADVSGLQANELHYTITDITGRVILTASTPVFQDKISISCAGLADGVYFLSLFAENKTVLTEKVVIMNEK